jgi:TolB-like protein
MASLLADFEYDIFISYRKNDNKYDGWVTDFVKNLNKELEATLKDKVTTYFDENPNDGLMETNNVEKSLTGKLNSLIFIPILSQTYCDPKSYAWEHEFIAFNRRAKEDMYGREVMLRNGNVACRILPVKIHDLDLSDLNLFQDELGSPLRGIDFFFKEPGVNRPLRPGDSEDKNYNKTSYRNQINKIANSIKEIIVSIQNPGKFEIQFTGENISGISPPVKSIAVLPFVNMSNDPEQEYFSDGISEEIINTLVQIPDLKVAGRTSAFSFRNKTEDLRSIGDKLNVNTILEGSVRKSGNRIRITAQLVEASTGFQRWSEKFDRELSDVFIIQDEIAKAIVEKLEVTLSGKPVSPKERPQTNSVEAYQLYLKGMAFFYKRGLFMFDGLQCFEDALKIDPDYALALAGLADSYTMLSFHSYLSVSEAWSKASSAAQHALQVGEGLAEVHNSIATIALLFERNWTRAESEYLKALELNPRYLQARTWYSMFYLQLVQLNHEEALRHARIAVEYDPLSSYAHEILSRVASCAGFFDEGIAAGERSVEFDKDSFLGWNNLGFGYHSNNNRELAITVYKKAIDISGRHNWPLISLLSLYMEPSEFLQEEKANFIYKELLTKSKVGYVSPSMLAFAAAAIGKNDAAIKYIREALDRHDPYLLVAMQNRPDNKALRAIPEIIAMMRSIGLRY